MKKLFVRDRLTLPIDHVVNSLIMEQASDTAEKLTELECKLNNIQCYYIEIVGGVEIKSFTEEAQEIFDTYYDDQIDELYSLFNAQISEIRK